MKDKEPLIILLVIFVILGLAWEPLKNSNFNNSTSTPSGNTTTQNNTYNYPSDNNSNSSNNYNYPNDNSNVQTIQADSTHSKYYNKITLTYVAGVYDPDPSKQYISLLAYLDQGEKVDVTGWKLISERSGNWVKIGTASTLPYPKDQSKNYSDVILTSGDVLNVVKGFSPINTSFRTNECTGFFGQDRQFYPSLDRYCPLPSSEKLPQFSTDLDRDDECRNFIDQIPSCTDPTGYINFSKLPDTIVPACVTYMRTQMNYNVCVLNHITDSNFAGHKWYVYLNVLGPLWRNSREKIDLYDNQGLLVSSISY